MGPIRRLEARANGTLNQINATTGEYMKLAKDLQDGWGNRIKLEKGFGAWAARVMTTLAKFLVGWMMHKIPMLGKNAEPTINLEWLDGTVVPVTLVTIPEIDADYGMTPEEQNEQVVKQLKAAGKIRLLHGEWDNWDMKVKDPYAQQQRIKSRDGSHVLIYRRVSDRLYEFDGVEG